MRQLRDNTTQTLGITIRSILEENLQTTSKNSETFGQIAENTALTLDITICSIKEAYLKTTSRNQRKFGTNSRQEGPNPRYHHS